MADPITLAVVGAGVGAMINPNDPIKGAVIGGAAGFTGGTALGAGAAGGAGGAAAGAAGSAGAAAQTYASTIPGLVSAAPGSQAALLAEQTAVFGVPGLTATGSAASGAAGVSPFTRTAWDAANSLASSSAKNQLSVAQQLASRGAQRGPNAPNIQSRPATGMKLPVSQPINYNAPLLALLEEAAKREERPMFSLL